MERKNFSTSSKKFGGVYFKDWCTAKKMGNTFCHRLAQNTIYVCQEISFRMLAAAVCAFGISAVSDTSLRKHFSKASSFLHEILSSMLSSFLKEPDMSVYGKIKNVLLVDASVIRQDGKKQEQQADVILHITPKTFRLYDADDNKIPLIYAAL